MNFVTKEPINKGWSSDKKYCVTDENGTRYDMEINILGQMVNSETLEPNHMLIVDGPLQFIRQDTGKPEFADMFYNVVGVLF